MDKQEKTSEEDRVGVNCGFLFSLLQMFVAVEGQL